jgi:membrane-associated phospholipid phosphatase
MNWWLVAGLLALTLILLLIERRGVRATLQLSFRGDIKRETAFLAQYGQSVCTPLVFILVWQLDPREHVAAFALFSAVAGTALIGMILKRLFGRVRPNREQAGRFLGPALRHANYRESFPSNHTATSLALSTVLARFYPSAAATFWALAAITALLRYVQDAHWPSDIVAGLLLGYVVAHYALVAFGVS